MIKPISNSAIELQPLSAAKPTSSTDKKTAHASSSAFQCLSKIPELIEQFCAKIVNLVDRATVCFKTTPAPEALELKDFNPAKPVKDIAPPKPIKFHYSINSTNCEKFEPSNHFFKPALRND
jgi:hypothetical protein